MPAKAKPNTIDVRKTATLGRCDAIRHAPDLSDADARCRNRAHHLYRNTMGAPADFCTRHANMADAGYINPQRRCLSTNERQNHKRRGGLARWAGEWTPKRFEDE